MHIRPPQARERRVDADRLLVTMMEGEHQELVVVPSHQESVVERSSLLEPSQLVHRPPCTLPTKRSLSVSWR